MESNEKDNENRLTENVFKNEEIPELPLKTTKKINKLIIIIPIALILILGIVLSVIFTHSQEKDSKNEFIPYNPIPQNEDLNFTEEDHRLLSRQFASQSMVLATNNEILPLLPTDQVVLFGLGTNNTFYGGLGSGEVYNKGTSNPIIPIMVLEGIRNKSDKIIYIENDIGYEIGLGFNETKNLTDDDVRNFSVKKE